jgi:hypothetical protein
MSRERGSRTKAVVVVVAVLLLTAILAYLLHLRPAGEMTPTPGEAGPRPEEAQVAPQGEARRPPAP